MKTKEAKSKSTIVPLWKRFILALVGLLFSLSLIGLAFSVAFNRSVGNPDTIKTSLSRAEVHSAVAKQIKQEINTQAEDSINNTNIDKDILAKALGFVITEQLVENNLNRVIDGTYVWLEGKNNIPQFSIDLADIEGRIKDRVAELASQRVKKLPACSLLELSRIDLDNIDIFSLTCNSGIDLASLSQRIDQLTNDQSLLGEGIEGAQKKFTARDLIANDQEAGEENIFERLAVVPKSYQALRFSPWILVLLSLLSGALIATKLSTNLRVGMRRVAIKSLVVGVGLIPLIFLSKFVFQKASEEVSGQQQLIYGPLVDAGGYINSMFNKTLLLFSALYLVVGIVILILLKNNRDSSQKTST